MNRGLELEVADLCGVCFPDEQERVQKKTFTKWINSHLSKVSSGD